MPLSREERDWLKWLLDEQARLRVLEGSEGWHRCTGCGGRLSERTLDCSTCANRIKMRRRRIRERWLTLAPPDPRANGGYAAWNRS